MEIRFFRIKTVMLRYFYANRREAATYFDYFYWPLLDMILFGYLGTWVSNQHTGNLAIILITSLVLWAVTFRTSLDIARNMAQELWDENLLNFFATPLTVTEWAMGLMGFGILSLFITIPYCTLVAHIIFKQNVFCLAPHILVFIGLLIISGWILGFLASSLLIYYGQKIETVVWAIPWMSTPFSSIYYPIEVLPTWMQYISKLLPTTYAFEGIRYLINKGHLSPWHVSMGLALDAFYLLLALAFFYRMFKKSKNKGLNPD